MSTTKSHFTVHILTASLALLAVFSTGLLFVHFDLRIRVAYAKGQIEIFDELRARALGGDVTEAVDCLNYIINYYPSGTKQARTSPLDAVVERARAHNIQEILSDLRDKTGRDYGSDPQEWINQLTRKKRPPERGKGDKSN